MVEKKNTMVSAVLEAEGMVVLAEACCSEGCSIVFSVVEADCVLHAILLDEASRLASACWAAEG